MPPAPPLDTLDFKPRDIINNFEPIELVSISPSIAGQPPTEIESGSPKDTFVPLDDTEDFDRAIGAMYRPLGGVNPDSLILGAKVDPAEEVLMEGKVSLLTYFSIHNLIN